MAKTRLLWHFFLAFLLVLILCVSVIGKFALRSLRDFYLRSKVESLTAIAQVSRHELEPLLLDSATADRLTADRVEALSKELGRSAGARLTLIRPDGRVIGDSAEDPAQMENHAHRPEVAMALTGRPEHDVRWSDTLKTEMLYVAIPVTVGDRVVGVVRAARPMEAIERELAEMRKLLWQAGALGAAAAALLSLYLARRMSRPIEDFRQAAERYARGDYANRLFMTGPAEFVGLAKAMNRMAREMDRRFREISRQRNEREAILASMREGVLAVDLDERIMMVNPTAEALLGVRAGDAVGRLVQEVLRHADLQRFLARALAGEPVAPEESLLRWSGGRLLQAECAPLRDEESVEAGLLVVFNDVTRLHQLENMRREFVANVSHELRTPITSIKGFVETLRDGALEDPENAGRFLEIIFRQAERLNSIIEDLLALSRIEREAEGEGIEQQRCELRPLLEAIARNFTPQSEEKQITLAVECDPATPVSCNQRLLEQAIGNLVDNAIKYSPAGRVVRLKGEQLGVETRIQVIDQGPGIPAQHLPRIFERFYRVDAARSREVGGTGLGLAIVKHIVQAHGGRVSVESRVGQGSSFILHLPLPVTENGMTAAPSTKNGAERPAN